MRLRMTCSRRAARRAVRRAVEKMIKSRNRWCRDNAEVSGQPPIDAVRAAYRPSARLLAGPPTTVLSLPRTWAYLAHLDA